MHGYQRSEEWGWHGNHFTYQSVHTIGRDRRCLYRTQKAKGHRRPLSKSILKIMNRTSIVSALLLVAVLGSRAVGSSDTAVKHFKTASEYEEATGDGSNVYIVKYYAPWCGHCKRLAPVWEDLASALKGEENVVIASVDCTNKGLRPICDKNNVKGFPTIKSVFGGESKEVYKGSRALDSMKKFAQSQKLLWFAES